MGDASTTPRRTGGLLGWGLGLVLLTGLVLTAATCLRNQGGLASRQLPVLFTVPDFLLTNQFSQPVCGADLRGKVWVATIIFTRCAGPCPKMTRRLREIQSALPPDTPVRLVSLTTDAEYDTPSVLQAYARRFGAQPDRWWFLTGDPRRIATLAIDGFKFVAAEKKPGERIDPADLFVHSTYFVVIDQLSRARAVFDYGDPGMTERLLKSIQTLVRQ